jgi:hypothetical protein
MTRGRSAAFTPLHRPKPIGQAFRRNIEALFEELLKPSRSLAEEQERHVRENLTAEELVVFDILVSPNYAIFYASGL